MKSYFVERTGSKITRQLLFLAPLWLLVAGCHKDEVQVYNVPNGQDQQPAASTAPTNSSVVSLPPGHPDVSAMQMPSSSDGSIPAVNQSAPPFTWNLPADWTEVPPSEMRVASFKVAGADGKQADVSVVPLPGMAGGDFANVNRWRGQVGLPAATDDELQNSAENIEAGGQPAQLYDIAGHNPDNGMSDRILAVIQHRDGMSWFFKMTGDADLVEQQKPAFIQFLKSLSFGAGQPQTQAQPENPADGDMAAQAPATPVSHDGQPTWQVPADWQEVSGGSFLVAKFTISGESNANAAVNVSASEGDGGGLPANVNRWRGQLGLPPVEEISTTMFIVPGGQAQLVDLSGTNAETSQPAEIIGVMVTQPNGTWFYRLMGNPKLVASQRDIFTGFVKGVKY
jgi:hypothetical protein